MTDHKIAHVPDEPLVPPYHGVLGRIVEDNERLLAIYQLLEQPPESRRNPPDLLMGHLLEMAAITREAKGMTIYAELARYATRHGRHDMMSQLAQLANEHACLDHMLCALTEVEHDSEEWLRRLHRVKYHIMQVVAIEEEELIPDANRLLKSEQAEELARSYEAIKLEIVQRRANHA